MEYNGFKYQKLHSMSVSLKNLNSCLTISYIIKYSVALVMSATKEIVSKGASLPHFNKSWKKISYFQIKCTDKSVTIKPETLIKKIWRVY